MLGRAAEIAGRFYFRGAKSTRGEGERLIMMIRLWIGTSYLLRDIEPSLQIYKQKDGKPPRHEICERIVIAFVVLGQNLYWSAFKSILSEAIVAGICLGFHSAQL